MNTELTVIQAESTPSSVQEFLKNAEKVIKLKCYTLVTTDEQNRDIKKAEAREEKLGIELPIVYPRGIFKDRYINTALFQILDFFEYYNEEYNKQTIMLTLFNCGTKKEEIFEIESTIEEFLPVLNYFNCVFLDHNYGKSLK